MKSRTPLDISFLVHGYPPTENAGTERHTAQLVQHLQKRGHIIQVICATRSVFHQHGEIIQESDHVIRIVNNIPARSLKEKEVDPIIGQTVQQLWKSFQPHIIHVQHLQFLSTELTFPVPAILTMHDAWFWCAAGGQERYLQKEACSGATPSKCSICANEWHPRLPKRGALLIKGAHYLRFLISPQKIQRLWKFLPISLRTSFSRSTTKPTPESSNDAQNRNQQFQRLSQSFHVRLAPSQYLAQRAQMHNCGNVTLLRHGAPPSREHIGGEGLVFIGTIAKHKGPHIVFQAYQESSCPLPIRFFGPLLHSKLIPSSYHFGLLSHAEVLNTLQHADALVLGSIWPENAPLIILEALSVSCPVIAPQIGGIPEMIVHKKNGLLYPPGDINTLRAHIDIISSTEFSFAPLKSLDQQIDEYEEIYYQNRQRE